MASRASSSKPAASSRASSIHVRYALDELQAIRAAADRERIKPSQWVRNATLKALGLVVTDSQAAA